MGEAYDPFCDTAGGSAQACPPPRPVEPPLKRARRQEHSPEREAPDGSQTIRRRNPMNKPAEELIGYVRPISSRKGERICVHFLQNDCLWGDKCRFSHNPEELRAGAPATTAMSFSNLDTCSVSRTIAVPKPQLRYIMTEGTRQQLINTSGVSDVTWNADEAWMTISGRTAQVDTAEKLVKRVITHCNWGISEAKVQGLLSTQECAAARVTLAPMVPALRQAVFNLSVTKPQVTIGSGSANDLVVKGPLISRSHGVLEFVPNKGALYIVDASTNGLFLNSVRLPSKSSGRVAVWHGDELTFPEPGKKTPQTLEFGYMVNVELEPALSKTKPVPQ